MKIGFFFVLRNNLQDYLHAASLVREAREVMPGVDVEQFSDSRTPEVPGVTMTHRSEPDNHRPLLDQRLSHYANHAWDWTFLDTDVSIRRDVRHVFADPDFDVGFCDRNWPHLPQAEATLQTMPFNTGVVFSRSEAFWRDVLSVWRAFPTDQQDWMSEQRAVYQVVRTGKYRIKILDGMVYNYPPTDPNTIPESAALVHYKGPRKDWLSAHATRVLSQPVQELVSER